MISSILQSLGCVIMLVVFIVVTVIVLYVSYILAIGTFLVLLGFTFYKVITVLKTSPS